MPVTEDLTFDVLDDLWLAYERGRLPRVHLAPGGCLGSIVELVHFLQDHVGALTCRASEETGAIQRAYETRRPVHLMDESIGFVTAQRATYEGKDTFWTAFQFAMHKALLRAGFPSRLTTGLVGAMDELQNNIHAHS